jgi:ABC-type lipoprotein export system ATPase subunit
MINQNEYPYRDRELLKACHLYLEVEGVEIFSDADFSFEKEMGYLITGPNEDANLDMLKVIGGIIPPCSLNGKPHSQILYRGTDMYEGPESDIKKMKRKIAFVFREGTMVSNLNIRENLLLPFQFHCPDDNCNIAMEKLETDFHFFGIPDILDKRPDLVSYSVKKKISYIRASLQEPELLLLERPMFNLDREDQQQVLLYLENMKKKGMTFIIASRSQLILDTLIDAAIVLEPGTPPNIIGKTQKEFANLSRFTSVRS